MFCKRVKKEVPPGIFISTPARIMAILQLCIAFTILAWHAGYPFAGELYETKSKLLVYQHVIGVKNPHYAEQFATLPLEQQQKIKLGYDTLLHRIELPYLEKLKKSLTLIFFEIPLMEMTWILLSILIPILLLKRVEGAILAAWLIPLSMLCFVVDNRWHGKDDKAAADAFLFPSETMLINNYLKEPLSSNIMQQHAQLSKAWELYLIKEWGHAQPSEDSELFQKQKEKGDFAFNLARLDFLKPSLNVGQTKHSYYFLGLALFWNLSFALLVWKVLFQKQSDSNPCKVTH